MTLRIAIKNYDILSMDCDCKIDLLYCNTAWIDANGEHHLVAYRLQSTLWSVSQTVFLKSNSPVQCFLPRAAGPFSVTPSFSVMSLMCFFFKLCIVNLILFVFLHHPSITPTLFHSKLKRHNTFPLNPSRHRPITPSIGVIGLPLRTPDCSVVFFLVFFPLTF